MSKTNRVLSMVLAILMVMSMASVFTFTASADPVVFATDYECVPYSFVDANGKTVTLSIGKSAVLLDTSITDDEELANTVVTRTWDGAEYQFTAGVNAFNSIADVEASGATQAIVTRFTDGEGAAQSMHVSKAIEYFAPEWNTVPFVRPNGENWDAIDSNSTEWTKNPDFDTSVEILDFRILEAGFTYGKYGLYGFTMKYSDFGYGPKDLNETTDEILDIKLVNICAKPVDSVLFSFGNKKQPWYQSSKEHSFYAKNIYVESASGTCRLTNQFYAAHTTLDSLYIPDSLGSCFTAGKSYVKKSANVANSVYTVCNSYLGGMVAAASVGFAIQYQGADNVAFGTNIVKLNYKNNYLHDFVNTVTAEENYMIRFDSKSYSHINLIDNYIAYSESYANTKLLYNYRAATTARTDGSVVIAGNYLIGVNPTVDIKYSDELNCTDKMTIYGNYLPTSATDPTGQSLEAADGIVGEDWYWLDAAMTKRSDVLAYTLAGATGTEDTVEVNNTRKTIEYTAKSNDYTTLSGDTFTIDTDFITATAGYTLKFGETAHGETINVAKSNEGTTFTFTVTDAENTVNDTWTVTITYVVGATAFKGNYTSTPYTYKDINGNDATISIPDTAVLLTDLAKGVNKGESVIARWDGQLYSFIVGTNAFATVADLESWAAENNVATPDVIVTDYEIGSVTISRSAKFYGPNWNTSPMVVPVNWKALTSYGADWTENADYFATVKNTADQDVSKADLAKMGTVAIGAGVAGNVSLYGITLTGKVTDSNREPTAGENVNIELVNICVNDRSVAGGVYAGGDIDTNSVYLNNVYAKSGSTFVAPISGTVSKNTVVDTFWIPEAVGAACTTNEAITTGVGVNVIYRNSNLRGVAGANNMYFNADGVITLDNNIFYNYVTNSNRFIRVNAGKINNVNITNNYILLPNALTELVYGTNSKQSINIASTLKLTDNVLIGFSYQQVKFTNEDDATDLIEVHGNFTTPDVYPTMQDEDKTKLDDEKVAALKNAVGVKTEKRINDPLNCTYVEGNNDKDYYLDVDRTKVPTVLYAYDFVEGTNVDKTAKKIYYKVAEGDPRIVVDGESGVVTVNLTDLVVCTPAYNDVFATASYTTDTAYPITFSLSLSAKESVSEEAPVTDTYTVILYDTADKTVLAQSIADAQSVITNNEPSINSKAALETVIAAANLVAANEAATEAEIIDAIVAINEACSVVISLSPITEALENVTANDLLNADVTPNSKAALTAAVEAANTAKAKADITAEEVGVAVKAVDDAVAALVYLTDIKAAIATAQSTSVVDATNESSKALSDAIEFANALAIKPDVTKTELDLAIGELNNAVAGMVYLTDYYTALAAAKAAIADATGKCVKQIEKVQAVIAANEALAQQGFATKTAVTEAANALNAAAATDLTHKHTNYVYNNDATTEKDGTKTALCDNGCGTPNTVTAEGTKLNNTVEIKDTAAIFGDVKTGSWYKEFVDYAYSYGMFNGTTATTFEPNANMNRAMFVSVLARIAGVTVDNTVATKFSDVPANKWYTGAVKWASDNGIVTGKTETTFAPLDNITREQMCALIVRFATYANITLKADGEAENFTDADKISGYAKEAVTACQKAGLVNGMGDGTFAPKGKATRAQVSKILAYFHKNYIA